MKVYDSKRAVALLTASIMVCGVALAGHHEKSRKDIKQGAQQQAKASAAKSKKLPYVLTEAMYPAPKQQPNYGPKYGSIEFTDTDPSEAIGGKLVMHRAVDETGKRVDERAEGITTYMVHWGLEVGEPGMADDKGNGDHGGDCRGFRDTGHVVMKLVEELGDEDAIEWDIPAGTEVPEGAVYFVGHTLYSDIHNLGKCTQTPVINRQ